MNQTMCFVINNYLKKVTYNLLNRYQYIYIFIFTPFIFLSCVGSKNAQKYSYDIENRCNLCVGSGNCYICFGLGSIICKNCEGTGKVRWYYETNSLGVKSEVDRNEYYIGNQYYEIRECRKCLGEKKFVCYDCKSSGKCKHCYGSGKKWNKHLYEKIKFC